MVLTERLSFKEASERLGCEVAQIRRLVIEERALPAGVVTLAGHAEALEPWFMEYVDPNGEVFTSFDDKGRHKGHVLIEHKVLEQFAEDRGIALKQEMMRGAPWPAFETKRLEILRLAAAKFLTNYVPEDPSTAPRKKDIVDFLTRIHEIPESAAPHMAALLLPDEKRGGRPPTRS